jgi:heptaprenyl diphosphate synthase
LWTDYPEITSELLLVDEYIRNNVFSRNRLLNEVVGSLVEAGGKRLRPALVILSSKYGDYVREKAIPTASAIEILHTATLVHDDIVDRAKLRRGRTTVSEKYGFDMAVYTGDFLFTKSVLMLSRNIPMEKLDIVAKGIKTICEGEVDQFQDRFNIDTSIVTYLKRITRKTAVLFGAACAIGANIAGCPETVIKSLAKFGLYYGMAFQIRDDINDFVSNQVISGKPVSNDVSKGVVTLPLIHVLRSLKGARSIIEPILEKKDAMSPDEIMEVVGLVKENRGIEYSGKVLEKYIDRGLKSLNTLPGSQYKNIMEELISSLMLQ